MYNNNSFDFNYDLNVVIKEAKSGVVLFTFKARENALVVNDAGFQAGGIVSGGHNYSIATSEDVYEKVKPFSHQAVVEGVEYKIMSKNYMISSLGATFNKRKKKETVIYLG